MAQRRDSPEISLSLEEILTMCIVQTEEFFCDMCKGETIKQRDSQ